VRASVPHAPHARLDRDTVRAALLAGLVEFVRAHVEPDRPVRQIGSELRVGRKGALSVRLDSGAWFDHEAGRGGDVLDLAAVLTGARDFRDTLRRVADFTGTGTAAPVRPCERPTSTSTTTPPRDTRAAARRVWDSTVPLPGTVGAEYLVARGVGHVAGCPALRFHPCLSHPVAPGRFPVLVAGVQDAGGRFQGIQRTYLHGPHKAAVEPVRASLGSLAGGACRLAESSDGRLLVGEGIESTAAAMRVLGWHGAAWAALGTPGLRTVVLPASVRHVTIAADRDAGGLRAAAALAERLQGEGRDVVIRAPRQGDFADRLHEATQ